MSIVDAMNFRLSSSTVNRGPPGRAEHIWDIVVSPTMGTCKEREREREIYRLKGNALKINFIRFEVRLLALRINKLKLKSIIRNGKKFLAI